MGQGTSNKGILGLDSIRVGGMKLDALPIAESAIAKQQWSEIQAADKANTITNIVAKYPKQSVAWVTSAIRECEDTIKRVRGLKVDQHSMINEYTTYIGLCEFRDKEINKLDPKKDKNKIKELKLNYPPYDVKAMKLQIQQCEEAIERSDEVVDKEHNSISELKELLNVCKARDVELKPFGIIVK